MPSQRIGLVMLAASAWLASALVGCTSAQQISDELETVDPLGEDATKLGDPSATLFGHSVCVLGDLDRDGVDDLAIGAPLAWSEKGRTGSVLVLSGRELRVLYRLDGSCSDAGFGAKMVSIDDLDGDGVRELAVGTLHEGWGGDGGIREVRIVSGKNGAMLHSFEGYSRCLGSLGDFDLDGTLDFVLACDPVWNESTVPYPPAVVSGKTGQVLRESPAPGDPFVHLVADQDGDRLADILHFPKFDSNVLRIESGRDSALRIVALPERQKGLWRRLLRCAEADLDGDGSRGLIVNGSDVATGSGRLVVIDGNSGQFSRTVELDDLPLDTNNLFDWLSYFLFSPGDLNGDGHEDLIVASAPFGYERIRAISGASGAVLWTVVKGLRNNELRFDTLPDRTGDGVDEIVVGSTLLMEWGLQYGTGGWAGRVLILSGADGQVLHELEEADYPELGFSGSYERHMSFAFPAQEGSKTIHGTVTIEGATPRSGWIDLELDNRQGLRRVPVADGRWSLEIPRGNVIACVGHMQFEEREAYRPADYPWLENPFEIEARWTPRITLRAVDADTGADIPEIELVPRTLRGERRRVSAPVELSVWGSRDAAPWGCWIPTRKWWVRAPGYAWASTVVDNTVGGERVVELRPGGDVRVQLLGVERKWTASIHLIRIDETELERSVWPTWHPELPLDLEGLPQGEYRLEVWGSELLAQTTFSVRAGESTRIELEITR